MILSGWRRVGISPAALIALAMAALALLLSRGAGAGWLVVIASAFIGGVLVAAVTGAAGLIGVRVRLETPTDAIAGEVVTFGIRISGLIPQLRTVTLLALDGSTHAIDQRRETRVAVRAEHRSLVDRVALEVRSGLPLGLIRPARRFTIALPTPLAIAPVPAVVSLLDKLGEDDAADVRTVRAYIPGDPARHVHWRSTARRGELMIREFDTTELLRGSRLQLRVSLSGDATAVEAAASEAAGLSIAALDAGLRVELLSFEASGARTGAVTTRREIGRRLAAALPGDPPAPEGTDGNVIEVGAS